MRLLVLGGGPAGSFTDPEYGSVGMTEEQAAHEHDIAVRTARYDDLVRPVADGHPDGFCNLAARGVPGEGPEERVQARVGADQVAFDGAEGPQLAPAQVHDRIVASAAGGCLPR
jgi:hypothetical protein